MILIVCEISLIDFFFCYYFAFSVHLTFSPVAYILESCFGISWQDLILCHKCIKFVFFYIKIAISIKLILLKASFIIDLVLRIIPYAPSILFAVSVLALIFCSYSPAMIDIVQILSPIEYLSFLVILYSESLSLEVGNISLEYLDIFFCKDLSHANILIYIINFLI